MGNLLPPNPLKPTRYYVKVKEICKILSNQRFWLAKRSFAPRRSTPLMSLTSLSKSIGQHCKTHFSNIHKTPATGMAYASRADTVNDSKAAPELYKGIKLTGSDMFTIPVTLVFSIAWKKTDR